MDAREIFFAQDSLRELEPEYAGALPESNYLIRGEYVDRRGSPWRG